MEYDLTLVQEADALAKRWNASRDKDVASLDFEKSDLDSFDSNQKGKYRVFECEDALSYMHSRSLYSRLPGTPAIFQTFTACACCSPRQTVWNGCDHKH